MGNKKWERPNLIVLTRSKPEEAVLFACKFGSGAFTGSTQTKNHCITPTPNCTDCSAQAAS